MKKLGLGLVILILLGCNKDDVQGNDNDLPSEKGSIAPEFQPYVENFIAEMNSRGLDLSADQLTVTFVDQITMPDSDRFCAYGYVNFQNSGKPRVEVINSRACWESWSEIEKENLMFHELGHAILGYGHVNGTLPNGSQRSLMCASETCNNYRVYNSYQTDQRTYYLDQLANMETVIPEWASEKVFSRTLHVDSFDGGIENWDFSIGGDPNNEVPFSFYISEDLIYSTPSALGILATSSSSTEAFGQWQKTYEIADIAYCSNILIRADIITENLVDGAIGITIDLLEKNTANEFHFITRYSNALQNIGAGIISSENFESQVICLPEETAAIRVILFISAAENTRVTFDNLEVELYE